MCVVTFRHVNVHVFFSFQVVLLLFYFYFFACVECGVGRLKYIRKKSSPIVRATDLDDEVELYLIHCTSWQSDLSTFRLLLPQFRIVVFFYSFISRYSKPPLADPFTVCLPTLTILKKNGKKVPRKKSAQL